MYMKMVLGIPWPPRGFLDHSGDPLPGPFLHVLLVDLASSVDGSDSAGGGAAGGDLGVEHGSVAAGSPLALGLLWSPFTL